MIPTPIADCSQIPPQYTRFRALCEEDSRYRQAYLEGRGPGQNTPRAKASPPKPPALRRRAWNLATSLAAFAADGLRTVDKKQYRERLEICDTCEQRRGNRCMKCGCRLSLKARGRAFACPLDQWPKA